MNKQSIEILHGVLDMVSVNNNYSKRLVIIEPRDTGLMSKSIGPFVSFKDLTSGDFFEIYRYKKSLEESKDRGEEVIK